MKDLENSGGTEVQIHNSVYQGVMSQTNAHILGVFNLCFYHRSRKRKQEELQQPG